MQPPANPGSFAAAAARNAAQFAATDDGFGGDLAREAVRLGFTRMGIAPAVSPPRQAVFHTWLERGFAGAMRDWLERHAALRADPAHLLPGVRSVIMLATDHAVGASAASMPPAAGRGRVARYAWGDDYHDLLRSRVNALAAWIERRVPGCRTRGVVDSAPLAEREFAWLAGLGWFGKNTMLIDPRAGSYFLLTALLTDLDLPAAVPVQVDHCGTCTACLDACPTQAFVEPRMLDASRCLSGLTIEDHGPIPESLRTGLGEWIFGCDICQEVCPWNRHAPGSSEPTLQPRDGETTLALADILRLDEPAFRRRFRGSALWRAKRKGLLRSAAIALGNRPDAESAAALEAAAADEDPVIRGAAAWALGRWLADERLAARARECLVARLEFETDDDVRAEIERALGET